MLVIKIIVGIVIVSAIIGYLFFDDNDKEEGAKIGAMGGLLFLGSLIPTITTIVIAVFLIKSCL